VALPAFGEVHRMGDWAMQAGPGHEDLVIETHSQERGRS
jgi:hypothetical protein